MGSPFQFPGDSDFMSFYHMFSQDPSLNFGGSYLDPNDPELQEYQKLAASPTGSEDLIRDYVGRRPSFEDYHPGTGRKLAAFLLGTLSGGGYNAAQKHLYAPLEQNIEDWEREGTGITSRARLLDAERQRELVAKRFGLQQKANIGKAEANDRYRKELEARRRADLLAKEKDREEQQDVVNQARQEAMEFRKEIHEDRQSDIAFRRTERERIRKQKEEEKANKVSNLKNDLEMTALRRGIDTTDVGGEFDLASYLAYHDAMSHPAFKNYLEFNPDADEDEMMWKLKDDILPGVKQALTAFITNKRNKYLRGEGLE